MLKITELTVRLHIVPQRRAARGNGRFKNVTDFRHKPLGAAARYCMGASPGGNGGPKERFTNINISESGDDLLIEQRRLYRCPATFQRVPQCYGVEGVG